MYQQTVAENGIVREFASVCDVAVLMPVVDVVVLNAFVDVVSSCVVCDKVLPLEDCMDLFVPPLDAQECSAWQNLLGPLLHLR